MNPFLDLIPLLVGITCISIWLHALWKWDWKDDTKRDEKECETCPFPCEKHNKHT